jgi:hypothetical protein
MEGLDDRERQNVVVSRWLPPQMNIDQMGIYDYFFLTNEAMIALEERKRIYEEQARRAKQ